MRRFSDYLSDVFSTGFADQDVEQLLEGSTPFDGEHAELADFVEALRTYRTLAPTKDVSLRAAALAAAAESASTEGSIIDPDSRVPRPDRRHLHMNQRLAVAASAFVLMLGMSGIATAADSSAPGDLLYGVDRALEKVGIGNGSGDERIEEAERLIAAGDVEAGMTHLQDALTEAEVDMNEEMIDKIQRHLDLAASKANPNAASAQEKVAEKKEFIEENKGDGVGADGNEFGQGVSGIAKGDGASADEGGDEPQPGPPDNAGPKDGKGKAPDSAGPPENAGPKDGRGKPEK